MIMEVLMNSDGHVMADAHNCSERVSAQSEVSMLPHILKGLTLLLHGIVAATAAQEFQFGALYLRVLTLSLAFNKLTRCAYTRPSGYLFKQFGVELRRIDNHLHVIDGRTVV